MDLVLTNTPSFMFQPKTGPQFRDNGLSSDHFPVFFNIAVDVNFQGVSRLNPFDFKNESLKQVLLLTPLGNDTHSINPLKILILFGICGMTVFAAVDTFVPKVNYKDSNRPPWISKELAKDINKKKTLWWRIITQNLLNKWKNLWNNIPDDVRQAEPIDSFKRKLQSFYFKRRFNVFDGNNFRTFKIICPKCRRVKYPCCVHLLSSLFSLFILLS